MSLSCEPARQEPDDAKADNTDCVEQERCEDNEQHRASARLRLNPGDCKHTSRYTGQDQENVQLHCPLRRGHFASRGASQ